MKLEMHLSFDGNTAKMLDDLKEQAELSSRAAVIQKAITLLAVAHEIDSRGGVITIDDGDLQYRLML